MKFGQVDNPAEVDFSIPDDHVDTDRVLKNADKGQLKINIGCAKWNKADLKGFYPRGVKDEVAYYASQFNSIELNATFYRMFPAETFQKWHDSTPATFRFFPKFNQSISHFKRLKDVDEVVGLNIERFSLLGEKLAMPFLQLHNNFAPKDVERVYAFIENWQQYQLPLAVEFRHTNWHNDPDVAKDIYELLENNHCTNVLVDTAGRRDLMHMRLTSPRAFVRYVGANHRSDYSRLNAWVERIALWKEKGLNEINFFIHQNIEKESPLLSAYFIKKLNQKLGLRLNIPQTTSPERK